MSRFIRTSGRSPLASTRLTSSAGTGSVGERPLDVHPCLVLQPPGVGVGGKVLDQRLAAHQHPQRHLVLDHGKGPRGGHERCVPDVVEAEREEDREREARDELVEAQAHRVPHHVPELVGIEEAHEVAEADPGAAPDAGGDREVPERDLGAVHRHVLEDQEIDEGQGNENVELPDPANCRQTGTPLNHAASALQDANLREPTHRCQLRGGLPCLTCTGRGPRATGVVLSLRQRLVEGAR